MQWALRILAVLPLAVSCVGHFFWTATYATIVPPVFPHPAIWVVFTGILELAGGIGLIIPKTAKTASFWVALLMITVFPANVYGANRTVGHLHMPGVPIRLAMQVFYVVLVLFAGWGIPGQEHPGS